MLVQFATARDPQLNDAAFHTNARDVDRLPFRQSGASSVRFAAGRIGPEAPRRLDFSTSFGLVSG